MTATYVDPVEGLIERFLLDAMQVHGHAFVEIPVDMAHGDQVKSLVQAHNDLLAALRKLEALIEAGERTYQGSLYLYLKGMLGHFRAVILHYEMIEEYDPSTELESLSVQQDV